ncbi:hypothetical protein ACIP5Y_40885 [Nocardia sp. NPDC088792]|uniref:hypothetical protein n=1 Tax=Nocardia sp. NPDC088792 TaxID=3364332 RepID=UPI00382601CC
MRTRSTPVAALAFSVPFIIAGAALTVPAGATPPEDARLASCNFARSFATSDYRTADADLAATLALTTGDLHDTLQRDSNTLRTVWTKVQLHAVATNVTCTLQSGDDTHTEATTDFDQILTYGETGNQPRTTHMRMALGLDNVGGTWLVSRADTAN